MKQRRFITTLAVFGSCSLLALTACTAPLESAGGGGGGNQEEPEQVVATASEETCVNASPTDTPLSEMVIGYSQSENEQNPFRKVETASVRKAVEGSGAQFVYTNANSDQAKQLSDIQSMINQGVDALIVSPISSSGLQAAFASAKENGVAVVIIDRETASTPCEDTINSFIGSDFYDQGVRAAQAMVEATGGEGEMAEIQGPSGTDVAAARSEGFAAELEKHPGLKVVAQQPGNWSTSEAQEVLSQMISSNPGVKGVYTHSDTMALGAITALNNFGKKPGEDVFITSVDGSADAVRYVASGEIYATVETSPHFGPAALSALEDWFAGEEVAQKILLEDALYTKENAQEALDSGQAY